MAKTKKKAIEVVAPPCPAGYGPREFAMFVTDMTAADALDPKLPVKDRELLRRQGRLFSAAFAELMELLTKGYPDSVCEFRGRKLLQALGSACFIGSERAESPIKDWLKAARATEGRKKNSRDWHDIVDLLAAKAWRKRPEYPKYRPYTIAAEIKDEVNAALIKNKLREVKERTIGDYLSKYEASIRSFG